MKAKAKQPEFNWGKPEPFALVSLTTTDGQRQADEQAQTERDSSEAEAKQTGFGIKHHD